LAQIFGKRSDLLKKQKKVHEDTSHAYLDTLKKQNKLIIKFDERLWFDLVDYMKMYGKGDEQFIFKDRTIIMI